MEKSRVARALAIAFICLLTLFSLDVFTPSATLSQISIGLFMHNIPSLVLLLALIIAWYKSKIGGVAFILIGVVLGILVLRSLFGLLLAAILFLTGGLFIIGKDNE